MKELYPLKFSPLFKDKIWGGDKTKSVLGLDYSPLPNCGEAWVLSGVENNETIVSDGWLQGNHLNELLEIYMDDLVGEKLFERYGNEFPLLIKLLDANDWLSIQVHPNDELAKKRHNGSGKTEMWYILQADQNAQLISGFNQEMTKEKYLDFLNSNKLPQIMNFEKVSPSDVFYMPSGRVHALGPGILLAEIQQTSDITYRMYDWDRVDSEGKARDLHTDLALDAIDFKVYDDYRRQPQTHPDQATLLMESPYFITNKLLLTKPLIRDYSELDSCVIYLCVNGLANIEYSGGNISIKTGECILVPALTNITKIIPKSDTNILEIFPL